MEEFDISVLSDEQQGIIEAIGIDAYRKLVESYAGCSIYVAKKDKLEKMERNFEIRRKFNGCNLKILAKEYGLSENTIRDIVYSKSKQEDQLEGQLKF